VIVWVASFPRSGNNLCSRQTLRAVFRAKTGAVQNLESLLPRLSLDGAADPIGAMREHEETIFLKTHRVVDARDPSPALYIVRDGRDSLVSYAHFVRSREESAFRSLSFDEALTALLEREAHPYGSWSANVRAWTRRDAPTAIVRFEELVEDPVEAVRSAVEALDISLPEPAGELPPFKELHERNPVVFRRGEVGSWTTELPAYLEERFWGIHGAEMLVMGYSRNHPYAEARG
jgi:hypothetical protein